MGTFHYLLLSVHIACTAVWFGNMMSSPGRFRRSLSGGKSEIKTAVMECCRTAKITLIFSILTFLTGLGVVFEYGGFANVRKSIHMAMGIVLLMLVIEFILSMGVWKKLVKMVSDDAEPEAFSAFRGKLSMLSGIQQLLWLIVLFFMVAKF